MYEPIINLIVGEMSYEMEGEIYRAIQKYAVDVNKEELLKALRYDRDQYNKGYQDGLNANKWIPCSERLPFINMSYPNANDYLVYYEHGCYDVASYSNINRFWHEHTTEPYWNCAQYCKVIAWQPLPTAYKGEQE